ncbi:MAG TPA: DUF2917 domain-containing protein [Burkholderiales bacterium]|nr:DUF2917 domain-containing protein [Burkholderiales bacterium]
MDNYIVQSRLGMPPGAVLRIDDGAGLLVQILEGEVWMTEEGSCTDHVMGPGQELRLNRGGAALGHALRRSVVRLSSAQPEVPARRITLSRNRVGAEAVLHQRGGSALGHALRRLLANLLAPVIGPGPIG